MTKVGQNFPMTRKARKEKLAQIKKGEPISMAKVPGKETRPVYKIPLGYLSYNPYNTRFLAQAKTLANRFGKPLSDEDPEHLKAIEKFIWEEKKDKNRSTIDSLIRDGQLQPGVVTADGIVLAGNRRFRLLNEITRNPDEYQSLKISITGLDYFEAVILDEEQLDKKKIIEYESFYQFGIEDKVEYNPIQKYIAANDQKKAGFENVEIAMHFMSITKGKEPEVKKWLEVFDYMDEYLKYIEEKEIYTALDGREEAFLRLHSLIKGYRYGKSGNKIWAYSDFDLDDLKIVFFDYIRLNIPTHDFRIFKEIFSDEEHWKNFKKKENSIVNDENNKVALFDDYRVEYPDEDESEISIIRQNDYKSKVEKGLNRLYGIENGRIQSEKAQEFPLDVLKAIQQKLSKLEADMINNWNNETYESNEFIDVIRDIQKRVGRIKQKVD